MKKLFIIRHAKSNQDFFGSDLDRPLNDRGKHDAPMMAKRLKERQPVIDTFVTSPAKRTRKTAESFISEYGQPASAIIIENKLYQAFGDTFYEVISTLPNDLNSAALFSHNPGITYFVNELAAGNKINNMPTCGIYAISVDTDDWAGFAKAKKSFLFFDYPKLG